MIGKTISHYKIIEKLGEGGMGVVYKAEDTKLKREVAIKFLPHYILSNEEERKRFEIEAQVAASLNHPNITTIYSIEEVDDDTFIVMEFIDGEELNDKIKREPISTEEAVNIAMQIAEGLESAHKKGITHRDIKSQNIMITKDGKAKIMDFGLAKVGNSKITKLGITIGTVAYMSPEQTKGEEVDFRTDIWSFGVVVYEMLTGKLPFEGDYDQAIIYSILNENPKPVSEFRKDVSDVLDSIIKRALAKNPDERYQDVSEIISDLKEKNKPDKSVEIINKDYRKLSAIMFTDIVGYSALTQSNEELALSLLKEHRKILRSVFPKYSGKEIETAGDSFFAEFESSVEAAKCAIEIQKTLHERNLQNPEEGQILLRIGLHVGDVVHIGKHVHGDGVNLAARLEPLASPGCICVSEDVARQIQNKIDYPVTKVGKRKLKNIQLPMNVYKIVLPWEGRISKFSAPVYRKYSSSNAFKYILPILLLALIGYYLWQSYKENLEIEHGSRIAVLPFDNISRESEDDYFADGITEEIISNLAKISGLDVIARTSILKYKDAKLNIAQIGNELSVGTVLEGSVRQDENIARITVQLIDVSTQKHLWAEKYDRELKDIFSIQIDIAMKVAEELKVQLIANEKEQIEKRGTENTDAYRNYLLGNYHLNKRTGENLTRGIEYFNKAIEYDPYFAQAYAGLANCYTLIGGAAYGKLSREEASEKANDAVLKALELDQSLAEAHASLGYIKFRFDWNWDEAEKELKKAIELKPGYAQAHEWYALFLSLIKRSDKALIEMKRAYELDPLSPSISTGVGRVLYFAGRNDEAISQFKKTLELYPNYAEAHFALAMSYAYIKKFDESFNQINKAIELSGRRPVMIAVKGMIYGFSGRRKEALAAIDELNELSHSKVVSPLLFADVYFGLKNKDKAIEYMYKGYIQRDPFMVYINTIESLYPTFSSTYGNDPRYKELLRKMDFEN